MDAIPFDLRLTCRRGLDALLLAAPLILCLLLLARRGAGALVEPLPLAGWLLTALMMALWLRWSAVWLPDRFAMPGWLAAPIAGRLPIAERLPIHWLPPLVAGLLCGVLWLPGTRVSALACYAAIVAIGGSQLVTLRWRPARLRRSFGWQSPTSSADSAGEEPATATSMPPAVVQQLIRRRDPGEAESLRGSLRTDFTAGQRIASAHVAICPPFVGQPRCQVAVASGPAAEVRVASALPFGVRFEIKLAQASLEPASVVVEFAVDSTDDAIP